MIAPVAHQDKIKLSSTRLTGCARRAQFAPAAAQPYWTWMVSMMVFIAAFTTSVSGSRTMT